MKEHISQGPRGLPGSTPVANEERQAMGIVDEMRSFEADHTPDGWPAVRMSQISALCDEVDRRFGIGGELIAARRERDELRALAVDYATFAGEMSKGLHHEDPTWQEVYELGRRLREILMGPNVKVTGPAASSPGPGETQGSASFS